MAEIKSTLEIALERANKILQTSGTDVKDIKYEEDGKKIAAKFMNEKGTKLKDLMKDIDPSGLKSYINGIMDILLRNITLPKDKSQWDTIERAFEGIIEIKGSNAKNIIKQLKQFLQSYDETKNSLYEQLKMQFQSRMSGLQEMIMLQYGSEVASRIQVDSLPQFQQEWQKILSEINNQYNQKIQQIKDIIKNLP